MSRRAMMRVMPLLLVCLLMGAACTRAKPQAAPKAVPTLVQPVSLATPTVWSSPSPAVPTAVKTDTPLSASTPVTSAVTAITPTVATSDVPSAPTAVAAAVAPEESGTYIVQQGDSLFAISLRHGVSMQELAQINGIADPNQIYAGQKLVIPQSGTSGVSTAPAVEPITPSGERTHVVQPGENLYRIGLKYGMSWQDIANANGITDPNQVYAGQKLVIP